MATPHVSGVAALIWSHYETKSAAEIWQALTQSAKDLGTPGRDDEYGFGLVQADKALEYLSGNICVDSPSQWHDSGGSTFDCDWYDHSAYCEWYGDDFADEDGITANIACCTCGGGLTESTAMAPVPALAPSPSPTETPVTPPPTPIPPMGEDCSDSPPGWYDSDGPAYDCEWYSKSNNCQVHGDNYPDEYGITANIACCACSGGSTGSVPTTTAPVPALAPSPSPIIGDICSDSPPGWHDSGGSFFDCEWYDLSNSCEWYGDNFADDYGITANIACCACGGGSTGSIPTPVNPPTPAPSPTHVNGDVCSNSPPGWYDSGGSTYDCEWYAQSNKCEWFGDDYADDNGITANIACCACGGGSTGS